MTAPSEPITSLALVVPCYNPQPGWGGRLSTRFQAFVNHPTLSGKLATSLILVHDGTPKGLDSAELTLLKERVPGLTFIDLPQNRGKGFALRTGMQAAKANLYVYTDVDLPYTIDSMIAVVESLRQHGGVAAGERFDDYYEGVPLFRRILSRGHRLAMKTLFRLPVSDSQAGLKGFDERGREVFLETTVDRFLVDLDFIARCRGRVDVRAVRVELRPDIQFTDFGLGILKAEAGNFVAVLKRSWLG